MPLAFAQESAIFSAEEELPQFLEDDDLRWAAPWATSTLLDPSAFRFDVRLGRRWSSGWESSLVRDGRLPESSRGDELYAMATLQVPLDDVVSTTTSSGSDVPENEVDESSEVPSSSEPSNSAEPSLGSSGEVTSESRDEAPLVLAMVRELSARVAALSDSADARLRSLKRRSRWSGLSPELRLRGVLGFDRTTSTEEGVGIYPGDTTTRGARDSLAEIRLTFRLDRLVLGDGEDSIERQRIQLAEERRKLVSEAVDLFMEWRRAQLLLGDLSLPPDDLLEAQIEAETAAAQLFVLTGGWFEGQRTLDLLQAEMADVSTPQ